MQCRQHGGQQLVLAHGQVAVLAAGAGQLLHQQLGLAYVPLILHMAQLAIAKIGQDGADQRSHLQQPGLGRQPRRQGVIDVDGGVVEGLLVVGGVLQIRRHPDEVISRRHQPVIVKHYLHHPQTDQAELAPGVAVRRTGTVRLDLLIT